MPSIRARAAGAALWALAAILTMMATAPTGAAADEPIYKGKRLSVLVNFAAGGPTDIEGRLFAKHIARHIDGQPSTIVQNMEGAGGLIGNSYLGEIAPKDGSVGTSPAPPLYATEPNKHRVVFRTTNSCLSARHHGCYVRANRGARHESGDRHRQGAGPGHRRAVGRRSRICDPARSKCSAFRSNT